MSDEEARAMVSPELRDLADRHGWVIKVRRLRLRVTKEVLEKIRDDRRAWHRLEQEAERVRRELIREVNRHLLGTDE
ncbi:MAG TPA: hypothetical protein VK012_05610 [Gemmatimonadales bacterium]|nr:hypothetical protein [Gemmatimonadales bacterium]